MHVMEAFHARQALPLCALVTDGRLQIHVTSFDQTMGMVQIVVQALLQHGLAALVFQPVCHCAETLKIDRHAAGALLGTASALAHGFVSPLTVMPMYCAMVTG